MPTFTLKKQKGLSLVEILLSLFLIAAIVTIMFATSGTFITRRSSSLQSIATKIATKEIENLRNTDFSALPTSGPITDADIAKLPNGTATRTVMDYQGTDEIKQVTINIDWQDNNAPRNLKMETLIYQNGL